ncbi:MAG: DUF6783 domain-containing protein, partial [Ruminococcus sp.]
MHAPLCGIFCPNSV